MAGKNRIAKPTLVDRIIARFAPRAGLERQIARAKSRATRQAQNIYDGASRSSRTHFWRRAVTDANAETFGQGATLRAVAHDLVRNNPHAGAAVRAIASNMVGKGIRPQIKARTKRAEQRLEDLARRHLYTTDIDADGRHDVFGLQSLIVRAVVETGEVIVRRRRRRASDGLALPFQLQVLEADFLDGDTDGKLPNGNYAVQGVEFDLRGRRVAYYLHRVHPGSLQGVVRLDPQRVPASEVVHIYRVDRPGQVRGVTWFAPVVTKLHDYADYSDAQLVRQKIAACFAAFITNDDAEAEVDPNIAESRAGYRAESLEPGMLQYLDPGENVEFGTPPAVQGFDTYTTAVLREIAIGMGIPYTVLTGDLSKVNFSSGRMGWLEFQRNLDCWFGEILRPGLLAPLARWFLEAAELAIGPAAAGASVAWIQPRREMIEPQKEIAAAKDAIRAGFSSRTQEARRFGHDPDELEDEIADEQKRADDKGLKFDSDPRHMSGQGQAQQTAAGQSGTGAGSDDDAAGETDDTETEE